jgi:hypothetical protein
MSVLEMVRTKVKELTDPNGPASGMLNSAKSAVAHGLDGASKFVDEKTNGKYSETIHNGVGKAKEFLGEQSKEDGGEEAPADGGADGSAAEGTAPAAGDAAAGGTSTGSTRPSGSTGSTGSTGSGSTGNPTTPEPPKF